MTPNLMSGLKNLSVPEVKLREEILGKIAESINAKEKEAIKEEKLRDFDAAIYLFLKGIDLGLDSMFAPKNLFNATELTEFRNVGLDLRNRKQGQTLCSKGHYAAHLADALILLIPQKINAFLAKEPDPNADELAKIYSSPTTPTRTEGPQAWNTPRVG